MIGGLLVRRHGRATILGAAVVLLLFVALISAAAPPVSGDPVPGSQGIDTSLPATDSAVTVHGRGKYANLAVTVNQTKQLVNQTISVDWTGGDPTIQSPNRFAGNYLQIMQCWGNDDGTVAGNPGPPPEQCVQGATDAVYGGASSVLFPSASLATTRIMSVRNWANFDQTAGVFDSRTGYVWRPFRAVDGTEVGVHLDPTFNPQLQGGNYWQNPYFDVVTTNEIAGGKTGPNGTGSELFQVNTGVESSGLGCGQMLVPAGGGAARMPQCWLVVVPRGTPAEEDAGTPFESSASQYGVMTSPLSTAAWANRIAIPLDFNPVDSPCSINAQDRRIVGSELAVGAVTSWQPKLCTTPGNPPYSYGTLTDAAARQQISSTVPGAPGMAVTSAPLPASQVSASDPAVYAPVTLSGVAIGFNVERNPLTSAPKEEQDLFGVRVADINLTPRLVAKLLTQSYRLQTQIKVPTSPYEWAKDNPTDLSKDPDFLQFNPEFNLLQINSQKDFGGLLFPAGNSDLAQRVWAWILADPEAKAWLDGAPDPWGMKVNPVYATTAAANVTGVAFGDPTPDSFPKADPFCYQGPKTGADGTIVPPPLCGTDWLPFTQSLSDGARLTRAGTDGARTSLNPFAISTDQVWTKDIPQFIGARAVLAVTDTSSAFQYGLQTAHLSRAGDDAGSRTFIAPDDKGLTAGVAVMTPSSSDPSVLVPDPTAASTTAYPLTMFTYAAVKPAGLDAAARTDYANFLQYAAGPGQQPGLDYGQLPMGYAPLPAALAAQTAQAATAIRDYQPPPETTVSGTTSSGSSVTPSGSGSYPSSSSATGASGSTGATTPSAATETAAAAPPATPADTPAKQSAGVLTPIVALARNRYFFLVLAVVALASALAALEITKRPRRPAGPQSGGST